MSHVLMYKYQATSLLLAFLTTILISGCSSNETKAIKGSEQNIYETAQRLLKTSNWEGAIDALQLLEENYPFGKYAEQSQLELIFAYFRSNEYDSAISAADRFIRLHPQHPNVDYPYYMRGLASFYNNTAFSALLPTDLSKRDTGSAVASFSHFEQLIHRFPESAYALDAQKRMIYLRNTIARYEIHVANYYFERGAFIAASNRGKYVVENMQTTPAVPDGLAVMAQAYHLLGMQGLADDAINVLKMNFPEHPALKNGEFNYQFGRDAEPSWITYLTLGLFNKRGYINFDTREQYDPFYTGDYSQAIRPPK